MSDEEILESAKRHWFEMEIGDSCEVHSGYEFSKEELLEFARAILKKANEK
jgi:hypothetical protein